MVRIYLFHGSIEIKHSNISQAQQNGEECIIDEFRDTEQKGGTSPLGKGLYGSTYYESEKNKCSIVYLLEFEVEKFKVANKQDRQSRWKGHQQWEEYGVCGVYMPPRSSGGLFKADLACLRKDRLRSVWLVEEDNLQQILNRIKYEPDNFRDSMKGTIQSVVSKRGISRTFPFYVTFRGWKTQRRLSALAYFEDNSDEFQ